MFKKNSQFYLIFTQFTKVYSVLLHFILNILLPTANLPNASLPYPCVCTSVLLCFYSVYHSLLSFASFHSQSYYAPQTSPMPPSHTRVSVPLPLPRPPPAPPPCIPVPSASHKDPATALLAPKKPILGNCFGVAIMSLLGMLDVCRPVHAPVGMDLSTYVGKQHDVKGMQARLLSAIRGTLSSVATPLGLTMQNQAALAHGHLQLQGFVLLALLHISHIVLSKLLPRGTKVCVVCLCAHDVNQTMFHTENARLPSGSAVLALWIYAPLLVGGFQGSQES